jgi:molecular chaperone DnaK (HSP70)
MAVNKDMSTPLEHDESTFRYVVGIDLGTTNSAVAYVDRTADAHEDQPVHILKIAQLLAAGRVGHSTVLPSFLYLPGSYELPAGSTALPWDKERAYAVGEFAREQGAQVPGRLVSSAKSWLCHAGVDRTRPILPWGAGSGVELISPVEASARYLQHIRESWNEVIAQGREGYRLEEQMIMLTVPASFDEVARELTIAAALEAGLPRVTLLEEPLAAFYAWLSQQNGDWQSQMRPGQLILVCDVGGGTTDFTIIGILEGENGLLLNRLAVGDHLMLGGDNMDLTLARHLEMQLLGQPGKLGAGRWHQLCHQCCKAKEALLGNPQKHQKVDITIMGSGRKLIADTLKFTLTLAQAEELILEGFFPLVSLSEAPSDSRRAGLTEWGLPYAQEPAVTRHLAGFWQNYQGLLQKEMGRASLYPHFVLFNGAALSPSSVRNRIKAVVSGWFQAEAGEHWTPVELYNANPELAVARGAAYYGLVRLGEGVRVGAGSPRAYFVKVEKGSDIGARVRVQTAVCLAPRGIEEGFKAELEQPSLNVIANQPVSFQLFSSSTRLGDRLGDIVALDKDEISALPPIRTVLRYGKKGVTKTLPARLAVRLTEVGTLELWCQSKQSPHRWQLQFDLRKEREPGSPDLAASETLDLAIIEKAQSKILAVYQAEKPHSADPLQTLVKDLVSILKLTKTKWPTQTIRKMADTLMACKDRRSRTHQHEARWLNLLGFCLRPGFGHPLDEWRLKQVWKLYRPGLKYSRQAQCRSEWWIFWRRVAGGLTAGQQRLIFQQVIQHLQPPDKKKSGKKTRKRLSGQEELELWMALANFERLPAEAKVELGLLLLEKIRKGKPKTQDIWSISRLGGRIPLYGPMDQVISSKEASAWLDTMLSLNLVVTDALAQSMVHLARLTGDRQRDLPSEDLDRVYTWLEKAPRANHYRNLLTRPEATLSDKDRNWMFGEDLPSGLMLT